MSSQGKFKDPIRRMVTADRFTFEVISHIGWDYSDVFDEGYQYLLKRYLTDREAGETPVGIFRISQLDLLIDDTENRITDLRTRKLILEQLRDAQKNIIIIPDEKRNMSNLFYDLAAAHLTADEIRGYYQAAALRIEQGKGNTNVVKAVLKDIKGRANGAGAVITQIETVKDSTFKENLVWEFLRKTVKA